MNKYLLVGLVIAAAGLSTARAQSFSTSQNPNRREPVRRAPATVSPRSPVGAFPRAARGNPIQMINPRAPQKYYGPPSETVVADDVSPSPGHNRGESVNRFAGVVLVGIRW